MKTENPRLLQFAEDPYFLAIKQALGDAELYLVGGVVRDSLLGVSCTDLDLASNLSAEQALARLESAGIKVVPTGLQHETITALPLDAKRPVEITSYRAERFDGGLTNTIENDLLLRDFTINAIAFDPISRNLFDPANGLADLENKRIKAVVDAEKRFLEDPLRILRAFRFHSELGFRICSKTKAAISLHAALLSEISVERIREELNKLILGENVVSAFKEMQQSSVLKVILPEIEAGVNFSQNKFHHLDVFEHTLAVVENSRAELILRLSALFHDISKPDTLSVDEKGERHFFKHESVGAKKTRELMTRLRYSKRQIDDVSCLVETHMRPLESGPGGMRRLLRDVGELYPLWRELKEADAKGCVIDEKDLLVRLEDFDRRMAEVMKGPEVSPLKNLAVSGDDLIELGLKPGPQFKEILNKLHEIILDKPELNQKEVLLGLLDELLF